MILVIPQCPTKPVKQSGWFHDSFSSPTSNIGYHRIYELQEVVSMANNNSNHVHSDGVSQQHTEGEHDVGQIRRIELKKAQKAHPNIFVSSPPDICHHKCQGAAQEM